MDRYDIRVTFYPYDGLEINLSSAVSGAVSITNGRTDLTTPLGQTYASLTFLKAALWDLLAGEGYTPSAFSFGALVKIWVPEAPAYEIPLFWGNITDMSSDAYEITFSLVANQIYKATGFFPYNYLGSTEPSDTIASTVIANTGGGTLINQIGTASRTNIEAPPQEITNGPAYLAGIVNQAPAQYMYVDTALDSWVLAQRPRDSFTHPTIVLAGDDVLLDYSLDRSVEDVYNSVSVVWAGGTYSRENATSIDRIGLRFVEITTTIQTEDEAERFATWFLGARAPDGFPTITFRTSGELLGEFPPWLAEALQPNNLIDMTAVTAEGFDSYAYIEQVRHTITRSQWRVEIIATNADYASLAQTWAEVDPATSWDDVINDPPNSLSWDDLLYTSL
jgi:hypothetical protein